MITNPRFTTLRRLLLASVFLFPVPGSGAEAPATVTLTAKDAGRTVSLSEGGTLAVRLSAQLGTGYSWHVEVGNAAVLVQDGEAKTETRPDSLPGGSEIQVFRFTTKAAGESDLKFQYFRGFEPGKKPLRTHTFHIKVIAAKS